MREMEDRHINISITTGTVVKILFVLGVAWLLFELRSIVLDVVTAIVIASAVEPGVRSLSRWRVPRVAGVLMVYLLVFSIFAGIFYLFLPLVLSELASFISSLPGYLDAFTHTEAFDQYSRLLGLPSTSLSSNDIIAGVRDALDLGVFDNVFTAASKIFGGFFSFLIIVVFSFYFSMVETGVDGFLAVVTPKKHQSYVLGLWKRSQHKIGLWMQGQLILGFLMGVLMYLILTVFQVPHALVLAVIVAVFEIIPVFGPILAAIPGVLISFAAGGTVLGITTLCIYILAQQFENHLIYPQVVTRVVGVPPLLVILALIIGAELAGFLGIILSVPIAAVIHELVKDIESGRLREHAHVA
ncbi:MAG: hypothetical protein RLZZ416_746 [Candidatus Parcubacteria bacterium]|jgi:predicted PurR-regulated permease PerM